MRNILFLLLVVSIACSRKNNVPSGSTWDIEDVFASNDSNEVLGCRIVAYNNSTFDGKFPTSINHKKVLEIASQRPVKSIFIHSADTSTKVLDFSACSYLSSIHSDAFYGCNTIKNIILNKKLQKVGNGAFADCRSINNIIWGNKIKTIGEGAFYNSDQIERVSLPTELDSLMPYAFYGCNKLKTIEFNKKLCYIGQRAFANSSLIEEINLPKSVKYIGERAFLNCKQVKNITLRSQIQTIGDKAFYNCKKLMKLNIKSDTIVNIGNNTFGNTPLMTSADSKVFYPKEFNYPEENNWSKVTAIWLAK